MLNFLQINWPNITVIVTFIVGCIIAIRLGYIKQIKQMLLYLVIRAEKTYGGNTGQLKFSAVSNWVYEQLPSIARMFISAKTIEYLINTAVEEMKKYLSTNTSVKSYTIGLHDIVLEVSKK